MAGAGGREAGAGKNFNGIADQLLSLMQLIEETDAEPTWQASAAAATLQRDLAAIACKLGRVEHQ